MGPLRRTGAAPPKPAEADYPKLIRWVANIAARPAVARALAAVDDVRTNPSSTRPVPSQWTVCSAGAASRHSEGAGRAVIGPDQAFGRGRSGVKISGPGAFRMLGG